MADLHEALGPISWLSGRWTTKEGKGTYPNITDFSYHDEMEFICIGQPMYNFSSISRHPQTQKPMHQERGFLRIKPNTNQLAFAVSHNFGISSIEAGTFDVEKKEIVLESNNMLRAQTKPPKVLKFRRVLKQLANDQLEVTLDMETENSPLTEHLKAVYHKVSEK